MLKFLFDKTVAAILLVVLSPVILICVLVIRAGSPGPGIFHQTRVGRNEVPFTCLKLRTMYVTVANVPSHEAAASGITSVGHFMRRSKLDELPQLLNVLLGEMSFVGPRPCLPQQTELIQLRRERNVFALRPGITGLAQIRNIDMSDPARLAEVDAAYATHRGFFIDLDIMWRTVAGGGRGDRVPSNDTH
ncbi:MAG: sugar transferase [Kaiparowitsia implicata GSE-PSE-MK54-09C]|jgi:O-antigen biosynthesis protein WbqP|nr:sugar transferase [Kaiparowitsia implicata GSE-PSE-MK54-09C]